MNTFIQDNKIFLISALLLAGLIAGSAALTGSNSKQAATTTGQAQDAAAATGVAAPTNATASTPTSSASAPKPGVTRKRSFFGGDDD